MKAGRGTQKQHAGKHPHGPVPVQAMTKTGGGSFKQTAKTNAWGNGNKKA